MYVTYLPYPLNITMFLNVSLTKDDYMLSAIVTIIVIGHQSLIVVSTPCKGWSSLASNAIVP